MHYLFSAPPPQITCVSSKIFTIIPSLQNSKLRLKEKNALAYTQQAVEPGFHLSGQNLEPDPWSKSQVLRIICEFIHPSHSEPRLLNTKDFFNIMKRVYSCDSVCERSNLFWVISKSHQYIVWCLACCRHSTTAL